MAASFPGSVKSFGVDRVDGDYIPADDMNSVRDEIVALETAALAGGWISSEDRPWSYASASSFTVGGNRTGAFTKGARLRWRQTNLKYGVVASSSYSAGTNLTTVVIIVNTDYTVLNAAISENYYSYFSDPTGWPGWFNYTPTWGGFSAAPAAAIAKYNIVGNKCNVIIGSTDSGTSNAITFTVTLPVVAISPISITCFVRDNSANQPAGVFVLSAGSATANLYNSAAAAWTASGTKRVAPVSFAYDW